MVRSPVPVHSPSEAPGFSAAVAELRQAAAASGDVIDQTTFRAVQRLWAVSSGADLAAAAPEYGREEFLWVLESNGRPAGLPAGLAAEIQNWLAQVPQAAAWLRIVPLGTGDPDGAGERDSTGISSLLAARWLCHLAGLRHAAVELLLTHPTHPRALLLQMRAYAKVIAPGCLDLPVAGHVDGLQTPLETLRREAAEELGLDLDGQTWNLREIGTLTARAVERRGRPAARLVDSEFRIVYAAGLDPAAWRGLRPDPSEVAGLALFALEDVLESVRTEPRRFASGIRAALALILRYFNQA